jgi:hypothetical protein
MQSEAGLEKLTNHAREKDHGQPRTQEHVVSTSGNPQSVASAMGPPEMLMVKTITTTMN